jgi:hypothetical protein
VISFLKGLGREPVETKDISASFQQHSHVLRRHGASADSMGARIEDVDRRKKSCGYFPFHQL